MREVPGAFMSITSVHVLSSTSTAEQFDIEGHDLRNFQASKWHLSLFSVLEIAAFLTAVRQLWGLSCSTVTTSPQQLRLFTMAEVL